LKEISDSFSYSDDFEIVETDTVFYRNACFIECTYRYEMEFQENSELTKLLIKNLKKSSDNKLKSSDALSLNEVTSSSKFTLAYDSLRELLEALALKNGYKVYNHECYAAFLKEIIKESYKADEFDDIKNMQALSVDGVFSNFPKKVKEYIADIKQS